MIRSEDLRDALVSLSASSPADDHAPTITEASKEEQESPSPPLIEDQSTRLPDIVVDHVKSESTAALAAPPSVRSPTTTAENRPTSNDLDEPRPSRGSSPSPRMTRRSPRHSPLPDVSSHSPHRGRESDA
jgi:hypothetical protein